MEKDRQDLSDRNIRDLWARGKFWEIFGFSSGDFTTLELAKQYSALTKVYYDNPEVRRIIDEAFATLNAPLTRQFYEGCRMIMLRIKREVGDSRFRDAEDRIWLDLWNWVSERWQEPPAELINAIKTKYSQPIGSGANKQTQTWSDEGLKPADLDSVMAAEAFAKEIKCQSCGKFDHTLRAVAFPYVVSILIASFRRAGEAGIFCHRCRCSKSLKWAIVSLLFGWWSIWGFFWNIGALVDNFRGGKMPRENNVPLIARLAWAHMVLGKIAEAKAALKDLLKYGPNDEALRLRQELDSKYPSVAPATTGGFRLGYVALVIAILAIYGLVGNAIFGGPSGPAVESTPTQPSLVTPSQVTPATTPIPTPKFTTSGTGAAVGQVKFPDGRPAYRSMVVIFKSEETSSFGSCMVDTNGYYMFEDLPVGSYDLYTSSYASYLFFTGSPEATITVSEHETTNVPTLTVLMNIEITLDNPRTAGIPGESYTSKYVIDGHNPEFTWTNVKNATYYVVTIWSTYTESKPSNREYDESQRVTSNMIMWPTSLSSLPYQEFRIDVEAYMEDGALLASGYELFAVDNPPEGWAFK